MNIVYKISLLLLVCLLSLPAHASEQKKRAAEQEAGKWLALVDGGQYEESWQRSSSLFRRQVSDGLRRAVGFQNVNQVVHTRCLVGRPGSLLRPSWKNQCTQCSFPREGCRR